MPNKTSIAIGLSIGNIVSIILVPDSAAPLIFTNIAILALATK